MILMDAFDSSTCCSNNISQHTDTHLFEHLLPLVAFNLSSSVWWLCQSGCCRFFLLSSQLWDRICAIFHGLCLFEKSVLFAPIPARTHTHTHCVFGANVCGSDFHCANCQHFFSIRLATHATNAQSNIDQLRWLSRNSPSTDDRNKILNH